MLTGAVFADAAYEVDGKIGPSLVTAEPAEGWGGPFVTGPRPPKYFGWCPAPTTLPNTSPRRGRSVLLPGLRLAAGAGAKTTPTSCASAGQPDSDQDGVRSLTSSSPESSWFTITDDLPRPRATATTWQGESRRFRHQKRKVLQ
jgi:hypothetical protein